MSGEWKPGDVVTATVCGRPNVRVIAGWSKYDPQLRWGVLSTRWADGDDDECWFMPAQVTDHRPLVVIDPESDEDVARLEAAIASHDEWAVPRNGPRRKRMQAALRSLVAPPKPKPLLDRLKERAPDGLIDPALAEQIVKEWLVDSAEAEHQGVTP